MTSAPTLLDFLFEHLTDVETAWSVGTFGAIAEFTRDAEETAALDRGTNAISVVTGRGGLRIEAHDALPSALRYGSCRRSRGIHRQWWPGSPRMTGSTRTSRTIRWATIPARRDPPWRQRG